jgi:hypothetical protein
MPAIVKGLSSVYSGPRRRYTPGIGWTTFDRYEFSNSADANAFAGAQAALGLIVDLDDRAPAYPVEVASPDSGAGTEDDVVDIYELPPLDTEKDIVESPLFQSLTSAEQRAIKEYIANQTDDGYTTAEDIVTTGPALSTLKLIRNGTNSFLYPTVEFRWTRVVGDSGLASAASGAYSGVATVFTTAGLIASIGGLPAAWSSAITNAAASFPNPSNQTNEPQYTKGWLKQQSNIVRRGINRNELSLRWVLGNWSDDLY